MPPNPALALAARRRFPSTLGSRDQHAADHARAVAAFDYRASSANVWRRKDRGEHVDVCAECGCETDIKSPVHEPRCKNAGAPS